jgi:peptidoglycan hydrolase CwlO-like protein
MDELAEKLDAQVRANVDLRSRLTEAVEKGEREQRESTRQVEEMQKRLAELEDSVLAAAAHSESTLSSHEGEVRRLEEAASPLLKRLEAATPDPNKLAPFPAATPSSSPLLAQGFIPRLQPSRKRSTDISANASLQEVSKTQNLEREVREMEFMLREAAAEMQRVVQRVHRGQDEVAELTGERDRAVSEMRRLKGLIAEEERKADAIA